MEFKNSLAQEVRQKSETTPEEDISERRNKGILTLFTT